MELFQKESLSFFSDHYILAFALELYWWEHWRNAAFCIQGAGKRAISGCVIYNHRLPVVRQGADRP